MWKILFYHNSLLYIVSIAIMLFNKEIISTLRIIYEVSESTNKVSYFLTTHILDSAYHQ